MRSAAQGSSQRNEQELLALWEVAVSAHASTPWQRDGTLLRCAGGEPPSPRVGERNARLLALRSRLFGAHWPLRSTCPACGAVAEFGVDASRLAPAPPAIDRDRVRLDDGRELTLRAALVDDLDAAAAAGSARAAEDELLRRCIVEGDLALPLDDGAREAVAARMESLDPAAALGFDIACPQCGERWHAPLDVGAVLCAEVRLRAEQVLLDVDALARAYGWNEAEVLALSPARRAAYLQLAQAA